MKRVTVWYNVQDTFKRGKCIECPFHYLEYEDTKCLFDWLPEFCEIEIEEIKEEI